MKTFTRLFKTVQRDLRNVLDGSRPAPNFTAATTPLRSLEDIAGRSIELRRAIRERLKQPSASSNAALTFFAPDTCSRSSCDDASVRRFRKSRPSDFRAPATGSRSGNDSRSQID